MTYTGAVVGICTCFTGIGIGLDGVKLSWIGWTVYYGLYYGGALSFFVGLTILAVSWIKKLLKGQSKTISK